MGIRLKQKWHSTISRFGPMGRVVSALCHFRLFSIGQVRVRYVREWYSTIGCGIILGSIEKFVTVGKVREGQAAIMYLLLNKIGWIR